MNTTIKIVRNDSDTPPGKLADAEVHFVGGLLDGTKLTGFAVWKRRDGQGENVTLPSRRFNSQGAARSYALLRAIGDPAVLDRVRDQVLAAYGTQPNGAPSSGE